MGFPHQMELQIPILDMNGYVAFLCKDTGRKAGRNVFTNARKTKLILYSILKIPPPFNIESQDYTKACDELNSLIKSSESVAVFVTGYFLPCVRVNVLE